jgi:hypothetical protein
MNVMARLVRATHDLRVPGGTRRRRSEQSRFPVFIGGPDKPGHDEQYNIKSLIGFSA